MARKVSFGRVADVAHAGRVAFRGRDERVVIHVLVDPLCPRGLALATRRALAAERLGGVVEVAPVGAPPAGERPDAAVVLAGKSDVAELVGSYARSGVPVGIVVEGALDAPAIELPEQAAALVGVIACSEPDALPDHLASWLASATDKGIALAANFPFCRRAVVDSLVARCAVENAAVGAISLIPGSDLPVMTANQAKLALDIAAAYGRGVEPSRAAELAGVVGGGLLWRAVARTLVGMLPGVGALLKAGVGFGGTMATGNALRLRFEAELARPASPADEPEAPAVLLASPDADDDGYVQIGGSAE